MKKVMTGRLVFVVLLIVVTSLPLSLVAENNQAENKPIGIISALPYEIAYLKSCLQDSKKHTFFERNYYTGKIGKQNMVIAQVGVGIVNASVGTAILIDKFNPKAIIMTGVAGGTTKTQPGDVIIAQATTFYDLGAKNEKGEFTSLAAFSPSSTFTGKDEKHVPLFFDASPKLFSLAKENSKKIGLKSLEYKGIKYPVKVTEGIITTTQMFCENKKQEEAMMKATDCIAFEMEGAGPAQVCYNQKVPYILIKSISDNGNFNMFNCLKEAAAKNAELLVEKMVKHKEF